MHTIIFANGDLPTSPHPLPEHDLLIAADGGARNAFKFGLIPDILIGDFDSLSESEIAEFKRVGAVTIRFPADKDETDLELALDFAIQEGATKITLYALFGGRWDMTFANLLLLAGEKYARVQLKAIDGDSHFYILQGGSHLALNGKPGEIVSVLPLGGSAAGLSYDGLAWPLEDVSLPYGTPRGVSNSLVSENATISLSQGTILVVHAKSQNNEV